MLVSLFLVQYDFDTKTPSCTFSTKVNCKESVTATHNIFLPLLRGATRTTLITILHPGDVSFSLKQGLCSSRRVGLPVEKFTNTNEKMNYSLSREDSPLSSLFFVLF